MPGTIDGLELAGEVRVMQPMLRAGPHPALLASRKRP
jgi:hypothetical protein